VRAASPERAPADLVTSGCGMTSARPVLLESPYGSDDPAVVARNVRYADVCQLDALRRGDAPMLGHLLYTRVLNDRVPADREIGLRAHLAWVACVELVVVYVDFGLKPGMRKAIEAADVEAVPCEFRRFSRVWASAFVEGAATEPAPPRVLDEAEVRRLIER
jgi:hypothetical protein